MIRDTMLSNAVDIVAIAAVPALVIFTLALSSCVTTGPQPVAVCPTLTVVSADLQAQLAKEVAAMPADSASLFAVKDWIALRDQVRACQGHAK